MAKYNDIDAKKWKDYDDIITDSLWLFDKRDSSGVHSAYYHGNFIPQIPNQLFRRYTKEGDLIIDPFSGSGTALIEAQRLGRNYLGIDLNKEAVLNSRRSLLIESNPLVQGKVVPGDSRNVNLKNELSGMGLSQAQFVIFHPPYWDIIKFSDDERDLSNCKSLNDFLNSFGQIIDNVCAMLERNRYCAVVIGDKYSNGEIVPLGFYCMNLFQVRGFKLKAIIVKNFEETRVKANQKAIWRYRALTSDLYIFKHEYIYIFKK